MMHIVLVVAVVFLSFRGAESSDTFSPNEYIDISDDDGPYTEKYSNVDKQQCNMTINATSVAVFKNSLEEFRPNFAKLELRFRYEHNVSKGGPYLLEPSTSFKEDAILPYQWVWTYDSPTDFFPYLKWPVDFTILSFGLLGAKTLKPGFLVVEIQNMTCEEVVIGNSSSILSIGFALRQLTKNLMDIDKKYSFSYWCYISVIPGVKETLAYQLGIYIAYPVEFERYNCCKTLLSKRESEGFYVDCTLPQIPKMWQTTLIPYFLGLIAFAFFPISLFGTSASLKATGTKSESDECFQVLSLTVDDNDFVFLTGNPPISLTILVGGLCGLSNKYPIAVSRIRRAIFVLLGPILILFEVFIYYRYDYQTTMTLLDHGCPMGYLSMIGGFEKSQSNFMPVLGGPYCLLAGFYFTGFIFVVTPSFLDVIAFDGTLRYCKFDGISPLFLTTEAVEKYSYMNIRSVNCGYKRLQIQSLAMFYTVMNPTFWYETVCIQCYRFKSALTICSSVVYRILLIVIVLPLYFCFCVMEMVLCIVYYGIPLVNTLCVLATGYIVWMSQFSGGGHSNSCNNVSFVLKNTVIKTLLAIIFTCIFVYFVFSFCSIFICSFSFLAKVLVFCFIAVLVYPSTSFGYLFFGVVFVYYIFKTLKGIGESYLELLADAVEVSCLLEHDVFRNHVVDGTVMIDDGVGFEITKLQIRDKVINLSTDQRQAMREACRAHQPKVTYRKNMAGIPRDLFNDIVNKVLPVHIQITHALMKILLILGLISVTISIIVVQPSGPSEGISEMMHVVFIVVVGALPKVLEVAVDNKNHSVRKEIELREIRSIISEYWTEKI